MANPILAYPCPRCGKQMRIKPPQKNGIYKITCPHCQAKANIKLPGIDAVLARMAKGPTTPAVPQANPASAPIPSHSPSLSPTYIPPQMPGQRPQMPPQMPPRMPGQMPQMPPQVPPRMPGQAPQMPPRMPQTPPQMPVGHCPTTIVQQPTGAPKGAAKLERIGKMFNDTFMLRPGITTIGRYDETYQSDIAIKGDSYMSRRSISIEMRYEGAQGFSYRLRVLKSVNPVLLNGGNVPPGSDVFLNFGDIITLGKTQFRLDPVK